MNCLLYARVSTGRQAKKELSIPVQFDHMRAFALERRWVVVAEMEEPGKTARTPDRPVLKALLTRLAETEPKINVVLVYKFDRWMRSVFDHHLVKRQLTALGVRLISVTEPIEDTPFGRWMENQTAANNEFYSDVLAERVTGGMRKKVELGGWPHKPPRGYVITYDQNGRYEIRPHPSTGPLIRSAFERYATGHFSLRDIAESLKDDGIVSKQGRRLGLAYVNDMLTNPFYVGRLRWKELNVQGRHEPLVSNGLFERVAAVLKQRFKEPGAKGSINGFPLRGLAICASCRGHMTAGWHKKRFGYYRCSRRSYNRDLCSMASYCPSKLAEQQLARVCASLEFSKATAAELTKRVETKIRKEADEAHRLLDSLRATRSHLLDREVTLTEKYVAGELASETYQVASKKLRVELAQVDRAIERASVDHDVLLKGVRAVISRAQSVHTLADELHPSLRPSLLRGVFTNLVLGPDGLVGFTLMKPFDTILKAASTEQDPTSDVLDPLAAEVIKQVAADTAAKQQPLRAA